MIKKRFIALLFSGAALTGGVLFGIDSHPAGSTRQPISIAQDASPIVKTVDDEQRPAPTTSSTASVHSTSRPAPASPSPRATVAATRGGNVLSIPSIGLNASITQVGLTADNAIDVPAGLEVGYWTGSARPGSPGATFLDGHVDGIFAHLNKVRTGQTLRVSYDGQTYHYQVVHTEMVALEGIDMNRALRPFGDATEGLNMMTCAGTYVPSIGTYDKRFVVYAVRT